MNFGSPILNKHVLPPYIVKRSWPSVSQRQVSARLQSRNPLLRTQLPSSGCRYVAETSNTLQWLFITLFPLIQATFVIEATWVSNPFESSSLSTGVHNSWASRKLSTFVSSSLALRRQLVRDAKTALCCLGASCNCSDWATYGRP